MGLLRHGDARLPRIAAEGELLAAPGPHDQCQRMLTAAEHLRRVVANGQLADLAGTVEIHARRDADGGRGWRHDFTFGRRAGRAVACEMDFFADRRYKRPLVRYRPRPAELHLLGMRAARNIVPSSTEKHRL